MKTLSKLSPLRKVAMDLSAQNPIFAGYLTSQIGVQPILSRTFSIASFISVIINFYVFL